MSKTNLDYVGDPLQDLKEITKVMYKDNQSGSQLNQEESIRKFAAEYFPHMSKQEVTDAIIKFQMYVLGEALDE